MIRESATIEHRSNQQVVELNENLRRKTVALDEHSAHVNQLQELIAEKDAHIEDREGEIAALQREQEDSAASSVRAGPPPAKGAKKTKASGAKRGAGGTGTGAAALEVSGTIPKVGGSRRGSVTSDTSSTSGARAKPKVSAAKGRWNRAVAAVGGTQAASAASSIADDFPPPSPGSVPASPMPGAAATSSASAYPIGEVIELQERVQTLTGENNTIREEKLELVSRVDALEKSLKEALDQVEELEKIGASSSPEAEQRGGVTIVSSPDASDLHTSVLIAEWRTKVDALEKELEETKEELEQTRIEKDALGDKWTDEMIKELEPLEEKLTAVEAENERLSADLLEALEELDRREGRLLLLRFR